MSVEAVVGAVALGAAAVLLCYGMLVLRRLIKPVCWRRVALLGWLAFIGWVLFFLGVGEVHGQAADVADYFDRLGHRVLDVWGHLGR